MYFIQGENMAKKKDDKTNFENKPPREIIDISGSLKDYGEKASEDLIDHILSDHQEHFEKYKRVYIGKSIIERIAELIKQYCTVPKPIIKPSGDHVITINQVLATAQLDANVSKNFKKAKANPLDKLEENIPEKNIKAISKAITNYFDVVEKAQIAIAEEIDKIIPEGIELTPIKIEKVVPPYVDVKIPVPEPRIPLDPKIPIPYPRIPLDPKIPLPDPKIPIPRPEIKIPGPYYKIKDLEIKLAEVERIRKSLPKNATKAEKKAAANAEQQIKNLLKAAKRAEPKATKKAVVKKATVKKATKKKK